MPSTRPYLNAHRTPCPARARIRTPRSSLLPHPSVRQGDLSRDPGSQVRLVWRHFNRPYAALPLPTPRASPPQSHPHSLFSRVRRRLSFPSLYFPICFPRVFCLVSLWCSFWIGLALCLVEKFLGAIILVACARLYLEQIKNENSPSLTKQARDDSNTRSSAKKFFCSLDPRTIRQPSQAFLFP